jgi:hemolysin III
VIIGGNFVAQEVASSIIHGVGLLLTVVGAFPLLSKGRRGADGIELLSYAIYLAGLLGWFATALLHHSLFQLSYNFFRSIIPGAAFVLIAATYTPFLLNTFSCVRGSWLLLGLVWGMAAAGTAVASTCLQGRHMRLVLMLLYLLQGYSGSVIGILLPSCLPRSAWQLLLGGGALFTSGIFFYTRRERPDVSPSVPVFYALVIAAAALHFLAVLWYVDKPSEACFADATSLGLAAVQPELSSLSSSLSSLSSSSSSAQDFLLNTTRAGRRAVFENLAAVLRELLKQVEVPQKELSEGLRS